MIFTMAIYVDSINYHFWFIIIIDRVTLPSGYLYLKNIIWNFLDICTSITIFQKTSFIRRKMEWMVIFYVCADASTKKVLLHSYMNNWTNNFSKFFGKWIRMMRNRLISIWSLRCTSRSKANKRSFWLQHADILS